MYICAENITNETGCGSLNKPTDVQLPQFNKVVITHSVVAVRYFVLILTYHFQIFEQLPAKSHVNTIEVLLGHECALLHVFVCVCVCVFGM